MKIIKSSCSSCSALDLFSVDERGSRGCGAAHCWFWAAREIVPSVTAHAAGRRVFRINFLCISESRDVLWLEIVIFGPGYAPVAEVTVRRLLAMTVDRKELLVVGLTAFAAGWCLHSVLASFQARWIARFLHIISEAG